MSNKPSNYAGETCLVCGGNAEVYRTHDINYKFVECETCGRFHINQLRYFSTMPKDMDKLASYLYYNGKISQPIKTEPGYFYNFIGAEVKFQEEHEEHPYCYLVTDEIVENWYPKSFCEKNDLILLGLESLSEFEGNRVKLTDNQLLSAFFIKRFLTDDSNRDKFDMELQYDYILKYLKEQNYISDGPNYGEFVLEYNGLARVDALQKDSAKLSKTAFVAMSFAPEMREVREVIQDAICAAGYIPRIMDEIEHNHQIVPEMLHEIRQAKFIVAELTNHNNGAYFEAGYALGLGKEVIQICKRDSFGRDGHFDVKQVNTILWDDIAQLKDALIKRIQATI